MIKKYFFALLCLLPFKLPNFFLRLFGVNITNKAKIGFSIILLSDINMIGNSKIGHFPINFFLCLQLFKKKAIFVTQPGFVSDNPYIYKKFKENFTLCSLFKW